MIEHEIRTTERLLQVLKDDPSAGTTIEERFQILPILTVVHKHAATDEISDLLFPCGGTNLEMPAGGYKPWMGYRGDGEED